MFPAECLCAVLALSDLLAQVHSNAMWRFDVAQQKWDRFDIDSGLQPSPRESASVASSGWMFGGLSTVDSSMGLPDASECCSEISGGQSRAHDEATGDNGRRLQTRVSRPPTSQPQLLSGMWQWRDSATMFYQ